MCSSPSSKLEQRVPALSFVYLNRVHRRAARARSVIELSFAEQAETSRSVPAMKRKRRLERTVM